MVAIRVKKFVREVLIPNKIHHFVIINFKAKIIPLPRMFNKEFKQTYGHLAGAWRGKKPIQRNAILALAHFNEVDAIPESKSMKDRRLEELLIGHC